KMVISELSFNKDLDLRKDLPTGVVTVSDPVWKKDNTPDKNDPVAYIGNFTGSGDNTFDVTAGFVIDPPLTEKLDDLILEGEIEPNQYIPAGMTLQKEIEIPKNTMTMAWTKFKTKYKFPKTTAMFDLKIKW